MSRLVLDREVVLLAGSFLAAAAAVALVRLDALRRAVLDVPNARSSHTRATPRGGGLGVVVVFLAGALLGGATAGGSPSAVPLGLCLLAAAAVATVGWLDDHGGLAVGPRLLVHVLAGAATGFLALRVGLAPAFALVWLFWTISSINVVNFMDGIDGLAASQAVVAFATMAALAPAGSTARALALLGAGATAGFLCWNWAPARIFMGDVGSGTLGCLLVLVGLCVVAAARVDMVRAFLPLFPFFLDATWTMVRRARNGERITEAHRSHLYQRLANGGWGHARVTLAFAAAALPGAAIAQVDSGAVRWALIAVWGAAVVAVGAMLDRTRPFVTARPGAAAALAQSGVSDS